MSHTPNPIKSTQPGLTWNQIPPPDWKIFFKMFPNPRTGLVQSSLVGGNLGFRITPQACSMNKNKTQTCMCTAFRRVGDCVLEIKFRWFPLQKTHKMIISFFYKISANLTFSYCYMYMYYHFTSVSKTILETKHLTFSCECNVTARSKQMCCFQFWLICARGKKIEIPVCIKRWLWHHVQTGSKKKFKYHIQVDSSLILVGR